MSLDTETTVINAAIRLAVEAEKVCDWAASVKDASRVDALRAALSTFIDAHDQWVHR